VASCFLKIIAILNKICVFKVVNQPHNIPAIIHNCRLVRIRIKETFFEPEYIHKYIR